MYLDRAIVSHNGCFRPALVHGSPGTAQVHTLLLKVREERLLRRDWHTQHRSVSFIVFTLTLTLLIHDFLDHVVGRRNISIHITSLLIPAQLCFCYPWIVVRWPYLLYTQSTTLTFFFLHFHC